MINFLQLPPEYSGYDSSRFVVIPLPYDSGKSWHGGAAQGPLAVIEASTQMESFDEEVSVQGFHQGIHTLPLNELPVEPERMLARTAELVAPVFKDGKIPICIGGDHSVSIGPIEEAARRYGPLDILHLDAHTDLRDSYQESRLSHACAIRRVWGCGNIIQVGIRSTSMEEAQFLEKQGCSPIYASTFIHRTEEAISTILERFTGRPLYITLDVDCLDPSEMPATGTPEPGGLSWHHVTAILRAAIERSPLIGMDIVELAPVPGIHFPQYTAARLIYKVINYHAVSSMHHAVKDSHK